MRFLNGVVIGFLLAIGLAYWHDRSLPVDGEGAARALVNWEVFGGLAAAAILPLYFIADSGSTLVARLGRGEKIWQPHRSHAYQRFAFTMGGPWPGLLRIGATNAALALASCVLVAATNTWMIAPVSAASVLLVVALLYRMRQQSNQQ